MCQNRQVKLPLTEMVLDAVGELPYVGEADLRLASDLQISARLDQGGVARKRHTSNAERGARADERQRRCRVHGAESTLPSHGRARDECRTVLQPVIARRPHTEGRIAGVAFVARTVERTDAARLVEAVRAQMHPSEARERARRRSARRTRRSRVRRTSAPRRRHSAWSPVRRSRGRRSSGWC